MLPQIFRLRQKFDGPRVENVAAEVEAQLEGLALHQRVRSGQQVAITAGSRGVANIAAIIKATVEHFQRLGAHPVIVPAMGSHGGGTAEGQRALVEGYGITEKYCGCRIHSSMKTVVVCETAEGFPVHFDRVAFESDHVVVVNRVKPHTDFTGDIESGLLKMMLIGLGKHEGAKVYHRAIKDHSFGQIVRSVAREVSARCKVLCGIATIENGYDETARIAALLPEQFESQEKQLLVLAKQWMARLPLSEVDVLLVDYLGKNISGAGMDTNVIGRKYDENKATDRDLAAVKRIIVRGLTSESHGNATGIGYAEFCHRRLVEAMDTHATWTNCITAGHVSAARLPIHLDSDRALLEAALSTIGLVPPDKARVQWIRDTLHLTEVECSAAYWDEAHERDDLEILSERRDWPLDAAGNLPETMAG